MANLRSSLNMEEPTLVKAVLKDVLPILAAKYPNKPSPVHISNNFVFYALGEGSLRSEVQTWVTDPNSLSDLLVSTGANRDFELGSLQDLISAIFNSDSRVFESFASPFPLIREVVGRDASDDGYALGLWQSLGNANRSNMSEVLFDFYTRSGERSSLSAIIKSMQGRVSEEYHPISGTSGQSNFGINIGKMLVKGLKEKASLGMHQKIEVVRQFSVLLGSFATLGMLYDACSSVQDSETKNDPSKVLGTFCYTGQIGSRSASDQRLGRLAVISLRETMSRAHYGITHSFNSNLRSMRNEFSADSWNDFAVRFATHHTSTSDAKRLVDILRQIGEESIYEWVDIAYPLKHLRNGVKGLGGKSGMIWSTRKGDPRIVLDTGFLTALVSFMGSQDLPVRDFVKLVYQKLGLILGFSGVDEDAIKLLQVKSGPKFEIRESLQSAEESLTNRLVSAGLARSYSDGSAALLGGQI